MTYRGDDIRATTAHADGKKDYAVDLLVGQMPLTADESGRE